MSIFATTAGNHVPPALQPQPQFSPAPAQQPGAAQPVVEVAPSRIVGSAAVVPAVLLCDHMGARRTIVFPTAGGYWKDKHHHRQQQQQNHHHPLPHFGRHPEAAAAHLRPPTSEPAARFPHLRCRSEALGEGKGAWREAGQDPSQRPLGTEYVVMDLTHVKGITRMHSLQEAAAAAAAAASKPGLDKSLSAGPPAPTASHPDPPNIPEFPHLVEIIKNSQVCKDTGRKLGKGSSRFLGVSKHKKSGRFEAHVWVPGDGKQLYLGGFECPVAAACAYDIVAIKVKTGPSTTNFDQETYASHQHWIQSTDLAEIVSHIKRQSRGFSRGHSKFRGVTQHPNGRWEARIGVGAKRHIYLGLYGTEERAAKHYDEALVRMKGASGATNFPVRTYWKQLEGHRRMEKRLAEEGRHLWSNKLIMKWVKDGAIENGLQGNA